MKRFVISAFADEASSHLFDQIRICNNNHIKFIEMRGVNGKSIVDHTPDEAKEIEKILDSSGFKVSSLGSPFGKISIDDDFAPHLEHFKRAMELSHILKTRFIRLFSFYIPEGKNPADYKEKVIDRVGQFLEHSDRIICCHENEKGIYGDNAERCKHLYDAFGGKLKLIFDAANFIQCGVETLEAYDLLADGIEYLHIKDALKSDGSIVPAGFGDGHLGEIINKFHEKEGTKFLSIEPHLKVFSGAEKLESGHEAKTSQKTYATSEEAFNAAATGLKSVLTSNGFEQSKDLERGYGLWRKN